MEEIRKVTQECREWQQKATIPERPQPRYQQRNFQRNSTQQTPFQSQSSLGRAPPPDLIQPNMDTNTNFQARWLPQRKFNPICFNCNERGHLMRDCTAPAMLGQMQMMTTSRSLQPQQQQNRQERYSAPPSTNMPHENYMTRATSMESQVLKGPESLTRSNSQPQMMPFATTSETNLGN